MLCMNQTEMAQRIGISRSYLSDVEAGSCKANLHIVFGIVTQFPQVNLDWLLTGQGKITGPHADAAQEPNAPDARTSAPDAGLALKGAFDALCSIDFLIGDLVEELPEGRTRGVLKTVLILSEVGINKVKEASDAADEVEFRGCAATLAQQAEPDPCGQTTAQLVG